MTFMFVFRRLSRRQSVKTFKAALDPQYAGSVAAGTMAMLEPVLRTISTVFPDSIGGFTHKMMLVGVSLFFKIGTNACVSATRLM